MNVVCECACVHVIVRAEPMTAKKNNNLYTHNMYLYIENLKRSNSNRQQRRQQ